MTVATVFSIPKSQTIIADFLGRLRWKTECWNLLNVYLNLYLKQKHHATDDVSWIHLIGSSSVCVRDDVAVLQKVSVELAAIWPTGVFASSCLITFVWSRDTWEDSGVTAARWGPTGILMFSLFDQIHLDSPQSSYWYCTDGERGTGWSYRRSIKV